MTSSNERPSYRPLILTIAILVAIVSTLGLIFVLQDHSLAPTNAWDSASVAEQNAAADQAFASLQHFNFSVDQGGGEAIEARRIVMLDSANDNWKGAAPVRHVTFAECEFNDEHSVSQMFNCNIAFSNGISQSYWVDTDNGDYEATVRTH